MGIVGVEQLQRWSLLDAGELTDQDLICGLAEIIQAQNVLAGLAARMLAQTERRELVTQFGATSTAAWLSDSGRVDPGPARRQVATALALEALPLFLNPQAEHLLDWFHITMRLTVMTNTAKGLRFPPPEPCELPRPHLAAEVGRELASPEWFLWHGNVFCALQTIDGQVMDLDAVDPATPEQRNLAKMVHEFDSYIRANAERQPLVAA